MKEKYLICKEIVITIKKNKHIIMNTVASITIPIARPNKLDNTCAILRVISLFAFTLRTEYSIKTNKPKNTIENIIPISKVLIFYGK